jgi:hypothetical protein
VFAALCARAADEAQPAARTPSSIQRFTGSSEKSGTAGSQIINNFLAI